MGMRVLTSDLFNGHKETILSEVARQCVRRVLLDSKVTNMAKVSKGIRREESGLTRRYVCLGWQPWQYQRGHRP